MCRSEMLSVLRRPNRAATCTYHLLGYVDCFAENGAQANSWEDIHVTVKISSIPLQLELSPSTYFP